MKKLAIFMTLLLAMSTAVLANPVFEDKGTEASNQMFQHNGIFGSNGEEVDILGMGAEKLAQPEDKTTKPHAKFKAEIYTLSYNLIEEDGTVSLGEEIQNDSFTVNQGQVISAIKSEGPKFKAGAELSKTARDNEPTSPKLLCLCSYDYQGFADLDGDGTPDIVIGARIVDGEQFQVVGTSIPEKIASKGAIRTEIDGIEMNKTELIEAMASETVLSEEDSKKALNDIVGELILGEDRDMVMPGNSGDAPHRNGLIDEVREDDKVEYGNGGFIVPVAMDKGLRIAKEGPGNGAALARGIDKKDIRR